METTDQRPDIFPPTRWSIIVSARGEGEIAEQSLNQLCTDYWRPVWQFILSRTGDHEQAEDLTQEYFADLLRRGYLASAERSAGKFRAFLCADVKLFLNNAGRKARAQKRGGGVQWEPLDENDQVAVDVAADDPGFDRIWALEVLKRAHAQMAAEYASRAKVEFFAVLAPLLDKPGEAGMYGAAAAALGMTEGSLKVALHRMRERLGALLREIVADTVGASEDVAGELRHLFAALSYRGA